MWESHLPSILNWIRHNMSNSLNSQSQVDTWINTVIGHWSLWCIKITSLAHALVKELALDCSVLAMRSFRKCFQHELQHKLHKNVCTIYVQEHLAAEALTRWPTFWQPNIRQCFKLTELIRACTLRYGPRAVRLTSSCCLATRSYKMKTSLFTVSSVHTEHMQPVWYKKCGSTHCNMNSVPVHMFWLSTGADHSARILPRLHREHDATKTIPCFVVYILLSYKFSSGTHFRTFDLKLVRTN